MSLTGAKGGSSSFKQRPDNLRSNDTFEGLLVLCGGPIHGPVNGLKSQKINGTPIEDASGQANFKDVVMLTADGDPAKFPQIATLKLGAGASPVAVGQPVGNTNSGAPGPWVVKTINNTGADAIDIRFIVSQLVRQDKKGVYEATANLELQMKPIGATTWINPNLSTPSGSYLPNGTPITGRNNSELVGYFLQNWFKTGEFGGGWLPENNSGYVSITGKTSSPYVHELRIDVPNVGFYANKGWDIRVRLIEIESVDADPNYEKRIINWESVAAVYASDVGDHEDWRGVAWTQIYGKASDQFDGAPEIEGDYLTKIVSVPPSNIFNPLTRQYSGLTWDGSFSKSYTNDPAWVINDALSDSIFGLSNLAPGAHLNKWDALEISKYCSQLVSDGAIGTHPRFSMNLKVTEPQRADEFIQYLAGAISGFAWDEGNGEWRMKMDKPELPSDVFTLETIEGEFAYAHSDLDSRFNDITMSFLNEEMDFREDRVRVFDQAHIDKYGRKPTTVVAIGCTSRQEALRRATLRLRTSINEFRMVSFTTNRRGRLVQPFDTVLIADGDLGYKLPTGIATANPVDSTPTNNRTTGRVLSMNGARTQLNLRDTVRMEVGVTYKVHFSVPNPAYTPNTTTQPADPSWSMPTITISRTLTNTSGQRGDVLTLYLDAALPANTPEFPNFALEVAGLPSIPKTYRILDVKPNEDGEHVFISAIEVDTGKYAAADAAVATAFSYTAPDVVVPAPLLPVDGILLKLVTIPGEGASRTNLIVNWQRPASLFLKGFSLRYRVNNGPYIDAVANLQDTSWEMVDPAAGTYAFEIYAHDRRGAQSLPLIGSLIVTSAMLAQLAAQAAETASVKLIAQSAATAAATAQSDATDALNRVTSVTVDSKLSRGEKPDIVQRHTALLAEQGGITAQATAFSVVTERDTYTAAVTALTTYLNSLTPAWNSYTTDTDIVRATFNSKFVDLYTKRQILLNKIAEVTKARGDLGVTNAAAALAAAQAADADAGTAQTQANLAITKLADIASDGLLTPDEKPSIIQDYEVILAEQIGIEARATGYTIVTEKAEYTAAVTALTTYLNTLTSPVLWNVLTSNTTIVGTTFRTKFKDVYFRRQVLLNKIDEIAGQKALWSGTTGVGKPADYATFGAPNGSTVGGVLAETLIANMNAVLDIGDDDKLTPVEKQSVIVSWDEVADNYNTLNTRRTALGITTEWNSLQAAYTTLANYLSGMSPAWNLTTATTTIVRATWRTNWNGWFETKALLEQKISEEDAKRATWATVIGAGRPADNATVGAPNGTLIGGVLVETVIANINATLDVGNDSKLTPVEKQAVIREAADYNRQYAEAYTRAIALGITAELNAASAAQTGLNTYLGTVAGGWNNTATTSTINRTTWRSTWLAIFDTLYALQRKISEEDAKRALWSGTTGRPPLLTTDGVTVDPELRDPSVWEAAHGGVFTVGADGKGLFSSGTGTNAQLSHRIDNCTPIDPNATYEVEIEIIEEGSGAATGPVYLGVRAINASGADITGDGSYWRYFKSFTTDHTRGQLHKYHERIGKGSDHPFPAGATKFGLLALLNHNSTAGVIQRVTVMKTTKVNEVKWASANRPAWSLADGKIVSGIQIVSPTWGFTAYGKALIKGPQRFTFKWADKSRAVMAGLCEVDVPASYTQGIYNLYSTGGAGTTIRVYQGSGYATQFLDVPDMATSEFCIEYDGLYIRPLRNGVPMGHQLFVGPNKSYKPFVDVYSAIKGGGIVSAAQFTAAAVAVIGSGGNIYDPAGTPLGPEDLRNNQIGVNGSGQFVNPVGAGNAMVIANNQLRVGVTTSNSKGYARLFNADNPGGIFNDVELPEVVQNTAQQWTDVSGDNRPDNNASRSDSLISNGEMLNNGEKWNVYNGATFYAYGAGDPYPIPAYLRLDTNQYAFVNKASLLGLAGARTLHISGYSTQSGPLVSLAAIVEWYRADNTVCSTPYSSIDIRPNSTAWIYFKGKLDAPTDATKFRLYIASGTGNVNIGYAGGLRVAATEANATVGATIGVDFKLAAGDVLNEAQVLNAQQQWVQVSGAGRPSDNATADIRLAVSGNGIVLSGNSVRRPTGGGNWDAQCYSLEGITGGAFCSFIPAGVTNPAYFMAGLSTTPLQDASYGFIDFCFFMSGDNTIYIYESNSGRGTFGTWSAGMVLSIKYDNEYVKYFIGGIEVRSVKVGAGKRYFFDSSFVHDGLDQIRFGPLSANTGGLSFVNANGQSSNGNSVYKLASATGAWNSKSFSNEAQKGSAVITWKMTGPHVMVGLHTVGSTDINYGGFYASFYRTGTSVFGYESGNGTAALATGVDDNTDYRISYDGTKIEYYVNNSLVRTVNSVPAGLSFQAGVAIYHPNGSIASNIQFGAYTDNAWASIAGSGKPADNATVGAQLGTNLRKEDASLIGGADIYNARTEGNMMTLPSVGGGQHYPGSASIPGYVKIRLPSGPDNTMLRFTVGIYEYNDQSSVKYDVGGHLYGTYWINIFATAVGKATSVRPVSFGKDEAGYFCVWIGTVGGNWLYPGVTISNFQAHYSNFAESQWKAGWQITVTTTAIANLTTTIAMPTAGDALVGINTRDASGNLLSDVNLRNEAQRFDYVVAGYGKPEANADVTATAVPFLDCASSVSFAAFHTGVLKDGQAPRNIIAKRYKGSTDVSASTTWSVGSPVGCAASISSTGVVTVTAVTTTGYINVTSARSGEANIVHRVSILKNVDAVPQGGTGSGGSGTTATDNSIDPVISSSYGAANGGPMTVTAGSNGTATLTAGIEFTEPTSGGSTTLVYGKWQWRTVGGSWADVAAEVLSEQPAIRNEQPGYISVNTSKTGLTNGTAYEFQLLLRRTNANTSCAGSATAAGS